MSRLVAQPRKVRVSAILLDYLEIIRSLMWIGCRSRNFLPRYEVSVTVTNQPASIETCA
jgi:hypothetical protein